MEANPTPWLPGVASGVTESGSSQMSGCQSNSSDKNESDRSVGIEYMIVSAYTKRVW